MENRKSNEIDLKNKFDGYDECYNDDSIDIIEKLANFISYLKTNENCPMLLKLSETDWQNEIMFKHRTKKILKHFHRHDQIIIEEKMINELQQDISAINNDLNNEIDKEKLEPNNIADILDKMITLKILNIKNSKTVKSLENFIKSNKTNLKDINKIEKEIKTVLAKLLPKTKTFKKSTIKITNAENTSRDCRSSLSFPNISRRNDQNNNNRIHPRTQMERIRRLKLENNDQARMMENFTNQTNIDQNTRRYNEDFTNYDLVMSSIDEDLIDFSSLNSTVNLSKDQDDTSSGDVHLILKPSNDWFDTIKRLSD